MKFLTIGQELTIEGHDITSSDPFVQYRIFFYAPSIKKALETNMWGKSLLAT